MTSHHKRLLTGLLPLPAFLWILYTGGWALMLLIMAVAAVGQWEFYNLFWKGSNALWKLVGVAAGAFFLAMVGLAAPVPPATILAAFFCLVSILFIWAYSRDPETTSLTQVHLIFLGWCYLPFLLHFALTLAWPELLLVMVAAFVSDTGAYYAGSLWGRRHIWPSISPKKTWMGSCGGMAACVAACILIGVFWGGHWPAFGLLGIILNVAGQFGDFFESALKRSRSIKDSGSILPGHGGILDRIDGLLFVLPLYAVLRHLYPFFG
jgi:phosphatidate cytidylyltransferase